MEDKYQLEPIDRDDQFYLIQWINALTQSFSRVFLSNDCNEFVDSDRYTSTV